MIRADQVQQGMILRRTRNAGHIYYTAPAPSSGSAPDEQRAHYIRLLRKREVKLVGREQALLRDLEAGCVPLFRVRRFRDGDGARREVTELVACPSDYEFREVQNKPGWS